MKKPQKERRIEQRRKQQVIIWSHQDRRKDSNGFINTTKSLAREHAEKALREEREMFKRAIFKPFYYQPESEGICAVCGHHGKSPETLTHHAYCAVLASLKSSEVAK